MNFRGFANAMISACTEFLGRTSRKVTISTLESGSQGFQYTWVRSAISVGRDRANTVLSAQEVCPTKFRHRRGHFLRKRQWTGCGGDQENKIESGELWASVRRSNQLTMSYPGILISTLIPALLSPWRVLPA